MSAVPAPSPKGHRTQGPGLSCFTHRPTQILTIQPQFALLPHIYAHNSTSVLGLHPAPRMAPPPTRPSALAAPPLSFRPAQLPNKPKPRPQAYLTISPLASLQETSTSTNHSAPPLNVTSALTARPDPTRPRPRLTLALKPHPNSYISTQPHSAPSYSILPKLYTSNHCPAHPRTQGPAP